MLPFAYIVALFAKLGQIFTEGTPLKSTQKALFYLLLGIPILLINFFTDCFFFVRDLFNENLERKDFEEKIVMNQDTFHSLESITTDLMEGGEELIETQAVIRLVRRALCIEDRIQELVFGSKQGKNGNGVESSIFANNSISMLPPSSNGETLLLQK